MERKNGVPYLALVGPDGGGKSTNVARLGRHLEQKWGFDQVVKTKEPGATDAGREIRALLLNPDRPLLATTTEALLMCADRAQHIVEVVKPALESGIPVVTDRCYRETIAYQGYGSGLDIQQLEMLNRFATGGLVPDLIILLDLNPELGELRSQKAARGSDKIEARDFSYHHRVREGFLTMARAEPHLFMVIDASQSIEAVTEEILSRFDGWFRGFRSLHTSTELLSGVQL